MIINCKLSTLEFESPMIDKVRLIVGYDAREAVAYHTFCQSVMEKSTVPLQIVPLVQNSLTGYIESHADGSNAFTYSRFLSPYLTDYSGWAIYADGDMICNDDIKKLWDLKDEKYAVQVVKHDYKTRHTTKYFGSKNLDYPRKNWSSLILWNCAHERNKILTPEFVSRASGSELHRFSWLSDEIIGELPVGWNWLANEYRVNESAHLIHYTVGTPCFKEFESSEMADFWSAAFMRMSRGIGD